MTGHIYFLRFESGVIKVGHTKCLRVRIQQLLSPSRGLGSRARLLAAIEGTPLDEDEVHRQLAHCRLPREGWGGRGRLLEQYYSSEESLPVFLRIGICDSARAHLVDLDRIQVG